MVIFFSFLALERRIQDFSKARELEKSAIMLKKRNKLTSHRGKCRT